MSNINRNALIVINKYKNTIFFNCNILFNTIYNYYPQYNSNEQFIALHKLFYIIVENVRIDLNYLSFLDPANDPIGFPTMKKNLRSTIEAFYDLYNLSLNSDYLTILKNNSSFINESQVIPKEYKKLKVDQFKFYSLKDKANIAIKCNNFNTEKYDFYKEIALNGNAYVHNDIFVPSPADKSLILENMLRTDCTIICDSYNSVNNFLIKNYNLQSKYNPNIDLKILNYNLSQMGSIII